MRSCIGRARTGGGHVDWFKMASMTGMWALVVGLALLQASPSSYDPDRHAGLLSLRYDTVQSKVKRISAQELELREGSREIGRILGESRRMQGSLTTWMATAKGPDSARAVRMIQVSGLFDAYVASVVLALDGDQSAMKVADETGRVLGVELKRLRQ